MPTLGEFIRAPKSCLVFLIKVCLLSEELVPLPVPEEDFFGEMSCFGVAPLDTSCLGDSKKWDETLDGL